jgi:hypothetical protein
VTDGALVIRPPKKEARVGWAEAGKQLHASGYDVLVMPGDTRSHPARLKQR